MNFSFLHDTPPVEEKYIRDLAREEETREISGFDAGKILSLIDLTSLEGKDNHSSIRILCEKALKLSTAAVCVYPVLVTAAKKELSGAVKIASVAGGFPSGQAPLPLRIEEVRYALEQGADEIDMVISRGRFLEGDYAYVFDEVNRIRQVCGERKLKVILETGELGSMQNIRIASEIAIRAGADFIKTSTGKIPVSATLLSVAVMLAAIKDNFKRTGKRVGIKPAGGISDGITAQRYINLITRVLGEEWINPGLLRFGASRLADALAGQQIKDGGY